MGGGSVDPATGEFNFSVAEGYRIRNGQIAEPVRGATLIGRGAEVLMKIDRVGPRMWMAQGMVRLLERLRAHKRGPAAHPHLRDHRGRALNMDTNRFIEFLFARAARRALRPARPTSSIGSAFPWASSAGS